MPKKKKGKAGKSNGEQTPSAAFTNAGSASGKRGKGKCKIKGKGRKSTIIRKKNARKRKNKRVDGVPAAAAASPVNYAELGEELLRNVNLRPSDAGLEKANALYQHPSTKGGFLSIVIFNLLFILTFVVCSKVFCGQYDVREFST